MRILKFIGVIVGTLLLVFLLTFGFNLDALNTLFENSGDLQEGQEWVSKTSSLKGLTEYIAEHPDRVSVASRSAINPDTLILYSEHVPRTMGTLSNFFLITTYARLVEEGELDPDEPVSLSDINRYQLPFIDASNHDDAVAALDNRGVISSDNEVPLQELVQVAIIYNDIAISDYLFFKLGLGAISQTYQKLNIENTDLPLPFAGLYISMHPVLADTSFEDHFAQLARLKKDTFRDRVLELTNRYVTDDSYHQRVNRIFDEHNGLGIKFKSRRDILSLFPTSTAAELSKLMGKVQKRTLISEEVSEQVRTIMSWPFDNRGLNNDFEYYGAIYDSRLGMLNGIDYGASTYSKEPFTQAVLFDSLQVAFWFHMSSNMMHQDYQQRLMWDPALRVTTLQEINQ